MSKFFAIFLPILAVLITTIYIVVINENILKKTSKKMKAFYFVLVIIGIMTFIYIVKFKP